MTTFLLLPAASSNMGNFAHTYPPDDRVIFTQDEWEGEKGEIAEKCLQRGLALAYNYSINHSRQAVKEAGKYKYEQRQRE
jgi:hypothetical protein